MSATFAVAGRPIPRADAPRDSAFPRGFFPFASTRLSGLPVAFWALQAYFFLGLSGLDEYAPSLGRYRPRLLLGLLALVVTLGNALVKGLSLEQARRVKNTTAVWLLAFLMAGFLSTLWAFDYDIAWASNLEHAVTMLAFFLLVLIVNSRREALLTVLVFCAGTGTYLLLSWWEWLHGHYDYAQGVVRMLGAGLSFADPNSFGATVVFAMPLVIWAGIYARSWFLRLCAVVYVTLGAMSVLNSSSRSALVLLVLTILWTVVAMPGRGARLAALLVLGLFGVALAATLSPEQVNRIESIVASDTYQRESSTLGRIEGYEVGWRIFKESPVLGVGPGNWSAYRTRRVDGVSLMPHNLTGQLIATRGAVGTVTFLGFLLSSVFYGWGQIRRRRRSPDPWDRAVRSLIGACLFTLLLLFVSGLGAHNLERPSWYLAPALMLVAATCRPEPEPEPAEGRA